MGVKVKATKEKCMTCKYVMNLTGASIVKNGESGALIACGYCLKNKEAKCRTVEKGKKRPGNGGGYCTFYEEGKRLNSRDNLKKNNTVNKRRVANGGTKVQSS